MGRIRSGALLALLGVFPLLLTACSILLPHPETAHPDVDRISFRFGDVHVSFGSGLLSTGGKAEILGYALACWKVYDVELSGEELSFTFSADYRAPNPTEARRHTGLNEYLVTGDLSQATLIGNALFVQVFGTRPEHPDYAPLHDALTDIAPLLSPGGSINSQMFVYRYIIPGIYNPKYQRIRVNITWIRIIRDFEGDWYYQILQPRIVIPASKHDPCLDIDFTTWAITVPFLVYWPLAETDAVPVRVQKVGGGEYDFDYVKWLKENLKRP
jgi:hypothetical protein